MSKINPPPITNPVIEKDTGLPTLPWILFYNSIFFGDTGTTFTPVPVNLTEVGTPTITGAYYRSGQFIDFEIVITPATSTTAVAGSTYFALPFDVLVDGACFAISGLLGSNAGAVDAATNRCYPPSWSAVTVPLTIVGRAHAR